MVDNTVPLLLHGRFFCQCRCKLPGGRARLQTEHHAADNCPGVTRAESRSRTLVGFGPHTVTITATDSSNNTASDDVVFPVMT